MGNAGASGVSEAKMKKLLEEDKERLDFEEDHMVRLVSRVAVVVVVVVPAVRKVRFVVIGCCSCFAFFCLGCLSSFVTLTVANWM